MKKISTLIIGILMALKLLAGGTDPKILNIPIFNQKHVVISGDNIWIQTSVDYDYIIQKRSLSTHQLLESYAINPDIAYSVNGMEIDADGNVWVYSNYGIAKIAESGVVEYTTSDNLPSDEVYDLYFDTDTVWAATNSGIGKFYDNSWNIIDENDGLPSSYVTSILKDKDGNLWVGSYYDGLYKLNSSGLTVFNEGSGLGDNTVNTLLLDNEGTVWAGTYNNGISKVEDDTIYYYGVDSGMLGTNIVELAIDAQNNIWAADNNGNFNVFDGETIINYSYKSLLGDDILDLQFVNGSMYVNSSNGLIVYNENASEYNLFGYPNWQLNAIAVDAQDNVWVAIDQEHIVYKKDKLGNWTVVDPQQGVSHSPISKIVFDSNGNAWVSTNGNGIFKQTEAGWIQYSSDNTSVIANDNVEDVAVGKDGAICIVTWDGAYVYDGNDWSLISTTNGLKSNDIESVTYDISGNLWFGYYSGLGVTKYNGATCTHFTKANGLVDNNSNDIVVDSQNNVWIATNAGISIYNGSTFKNLSLGNYWDDNVDVASLFVASNDKVYASREYGFYFAIFESDTSRYFRFTDYGVDVVSMAEDSNGDIWMASSNSGINFLRQPPVVNFKKTDTICQGETILMENTSPDALIGYAWDINNDGTVEATTEDYSCLFASAGTFSVKFSAANDLDTNFIIKKITVLPKPEVVIQSSTGSNVMCENSQMALSVGVFSSYKWSDNTENPGIIVTKEDTYTVTVTNQYGCSAQGSFGVTINPAPAVAITSPAPQGYVCPGSDVVLTAETSASEFKWNISGNSNTITAQEIGIYTVTVTDALGCTNSAQYEVKNYEPYAEQLGVVTTSKFNENLIVAWERTPDVRTTSYDVYREDGETFVKIGTVPFSENSLFVDTAANFEQQAYTYKIITTDECGNKSALDDCISHTSMHLLKIPYGNDFQLLWTPYKGIDVKSYAIYQTTDGSDLALLATLSGKNNTTYTVTDYDKTKEFRVGVNLGYDVVTTEMKNESGPYSQSLSNISESNISGLKNSKIDADIVVFPTTATTVVNVAIVGFDANNYQIQLVSATGAVLQTKTLNSIVSGSVNFGLEQFSNGSYSVVVKSEGHLETIKFFKK